MLFEEQLGKFVGL